MNVFVREEVFCESESFHERELFSRGIHLTKNKKKKNEKCVLCEVFKLTKTSAKL